MSKQNCSWRRTIRESCHEEEKNLPQDCVESDDGRHCDHWCDGLGCCDCGNECIDED